MEQPEIKSYRFVLNFHNFLWNLYFLLEPIQDGDLSLNLDLERVEIPSFEIRAAKIKEGIETLISTPLPEDIVALSNLSSEDSKTAVLVEPIKTINPLKIDLSEKVSFILLLSYPFF